MIFSIKNPSPHSRRWLFGLASLVTIISLISGVAWAAPAADPQASGTWLYWKPQRVTSAQLFSWMGDRSLRLDATANHYPHIAFGGDHLYYASYVAAGGNCGPANSWQCETVDPADGVGLYASLFLDSQNRPHISYYDSAHGSLKYARWNGSAWEIKTVDAPSMTAEFTLADDQPLTVEDNPNRLAMPRDWAGEVQPQTGGTPDAEALLAAVGGDQGRGLYSAIAVDSSDNPHIAYYDSINGDLKYARYLSISNSWQIQTVDYDGDTGQYISMALDSSNYAHISYYDVSKGDLRYSRWTGTSWSRQTVDSGGNVGLYTSLAVDSSKKPYIAYYDLSNGNLKFADGSSGSFSVETVAASDDIGTFVSLALDANKRAHISYYDESHNRLKYIYWTGTQWSSQTVTLPGSNAYGKYTSLALENGNARISFFDTENGELKYAVKTGATSWIFDTIAASVDEGYFSSLAFDPAGNPHISFFDDVGDQLKYAYWTGSGWNVQVVDTNGSVGLYNSLAIDSAGKAHIAYYDVSNAHLKYAHWNGSNWQISTVDANANVGKYASIALSSDGRPYIAYFDEQGGNLKFTFWNGTSWDFSIAYVDTGDPEVVGLYTSIKLDHSNLPHISYFDATKKVLKYAYWSTASNNWVKQVADDGQDYHYEVGLFTSLALDSADRPHIVHFEDSGDNLKYTYWNGSGWVSTRLAESGSAGWYPSIVLDSSDNPHISYYEADTGSLHYVGWNGSGWRFSFVDGNGDVGRYGCIALSPGGLLAISYFDATNGDLKYSTAALGYALFLPIVRR